MTFLPSPVYIERRRLERVDSLRKDIAAVLLILGRQLPYTTDEDDLKRSLNTLTAIAELNAELLVRKGRR